MPVTGHSLRAPALRSLHAGSASPSWLRLPPSPALGHGQPLATSSLACDSGRRSSRFGGTRRSRCDLCLAVVAPARLSRELTSPAGAEHASGRLRCRDDTPGSSVSRIACWPAGSRPLPGQANLGFAHAGLKAAGAMDGLASRRRIPSGLRRLTCWPAGSRPLPGQANLGFAHAGLKAAGAMDGPAAVKLERQAVVGKDVAAFIGMEAARDLLRQHLEEHSAEIRLRAVAGRDGAIGRKREVIDPLFE